MPLLPARERPDGPLHGFKLAHPMVSADGTRAGFSGVTLGRSSVYGVTADARCAQGARHRSPSRWCDCGFYCLHTLDEARAMCCDPDYRWAAILEVAASGRFLRYERGLRYQRQRVTAVRVGRCGCGGPAGVLAKDEYGPAGWQRLTGCCPDCAGRRPAVSLGEFARLLGGPPVTSDDLAQPPVSADPPLSPGPAGQPADAAAGPAAASLDGVDREALLPLLSAEVTLLQARLDELQRQLARLADGG